MSNNYGSNMGSYINNVTDANEENYVLVNENNVLNNTYNTVYSNNEQSKIDLIENTISAYREQSKEAIISNPLSNWNKNTEYRHETYWQNKKDYYKSMINDLTLEELTQELESLSEEVGSEMEYVNQGNAGNYGMSEMEMEGNSGSNSISPMTQTNIVEGMNDYKNTKGDSLWVDDWTILFQQSKLTEFIPNSTMTINEKLNAATRFAIYLSVILYIYNKDSKSFFVAIFVMGLVYFVYNGNDTYNEHFVTDILQPDRQIIISSDGKSCSLEPPQNQFKLCEKKCVAPTLHNPFMNVMINDYVDNPNRPAACKSFNNENIREQINKKFNYNLYKDVSDVFDRNNSQRQFVTTPATTIPNDQTKFANWLYGLPKTCKEGNYSNCYY